LLDEVEEGLEGEDLVKLVSLLSDCSEDHQVIIASHYKPILALANEMIGVAMEECGVSKLLGILLSN